MTASTPCACRTSAEAHRDAWGVARSVDVAAVVQSVSIGDDLSVSADDSSDGIGKLRDGQSERGKSSGGLGEFGLCEAGIVGGLEGMPLGVHEQVDVGGGILGSSHAAEPTDDCEKCATARQHHVAFTAGRAA